MYSDLPWFYEEAVETVATTTNSVYKMRLLNEVMPIIIEQW